MLVYQQNTNLIKDYVEEAREVTNILIQPGQMAVQQKLASLTAAEVDAILHKLDALAMSVMNEAVAIMVAEEAIGILTAVRIVKAQTKNPFAGILGAGPTLDIAWLRAKDIGGTILNKDETGSKGVHGQTNSTTAWLYEHTADTSTEMIPEQTMKEEAGVIHLGAMDPIEVPKLEAYLWTLAGVPTGAQSLEFRVRKGFGNNEVPIARFEKPVIVGPKGVQKLEVEPYADGDDKCQLLSLLIAQTQDLSL